MLYIGYLICRKCGVHGDWGTKHVCSNCGHNKGDKDE